MECPNLKASAGPCSAKKRIHSRHIIWKRLARLLARIHRYIMKHWLPIRYDHECSRVEELDLCDVMTPRYAIHLATTKAWQLGRDITKPTVWSIFLQATPYILDTPPICQNHAVCQHGSAASRHLKSASHLRLHQLQSPTQSPLLQPSQSW